MDSGREVEIKPDQADLMLQEVQTEEAPEEVLEEEEGVPNRDHHTSIRAKCSKRMAILDQKLSIRKDLAKDLITIDVETIVATSDLISVLVVVVEEVVEVVETNILDTSGRLHTTTKKITMLIMHLTNM